MKILAKAVLLSGSALLSAGLIALPGTAFAQDAVFVLTARDVGAPSYDPIKGTRTQRRRFADLRSARRSGYRPELPRSSRRLLGVHAGRHAVDIQVAPGCQIPQRRTLQRQNHRMVDSQIQGDRKLLHDRLDREGRGDRRSDGAIRHEDAGPEHAFQSCKHVHERA